MHIMAIKGGLEQNDPRACIINIFYYFTAISPNTQSRNDDPAENVILSTNFESGKFAYVEALPATVKAPFQTRGLIADEKRIHGYRNCQQICSAIG